MPPKLSAFAEQRTIVNTKLKFRFLPRHSQGRISSISDLIQTIMQHAFHKSSLGQ